MKEWNSLIKNCDTESAFQISLSSLMDSLASYPQVVEYLNKNIIPLKEKFASPWTNKIKHFGNLATSRVEGQHRVIKSYLSGSTGDLLTAVESIQLSVCNQAREYKTQLEQAKIRKCHRFDQFFDHVVNKVSEHALDMVLKQIKLPHPLPCCKNVFSTIYELPCAHTCDLRKRNGIKIEVSDFSSQWHLFGTVTTQSTDDLLQIEFNRIAEIAKYGENTAVTVLNSLASVAHYRSINEPIVHQGRGRPVGSISNLNSTRRDPSLFEHIEGAKGRRRCLKCKGKGHNSRT